MSKNKKYPRYFIHVTKFEDDTSHIMVEKGGLVKWYDKSGIFTVANEWMTEDGVKVDEKWCESWVKVGKWKEIDISEAVLKF